MLLSNLWTEIQGGDTILDIDRMGGFEAPSSRPHKTRRKVLVESMVPRALRVANFCP